MNKYLQEYSNFWQDFLSPSWQSYIYLFIFLSLLVYSVELLRPWRKSQARIRKDFWLDLFYCFFNLFFIHLLFFKFGSQFFVEQINHLFTLVGWQNYAANRVQSLPLWGQILLLFVLKDFIQWNIHRLLHHFDFLWNFHKVHHSVEEMGFAAHLRYHWMENVFYNSLQYLPLAIIGFGLDQYLIVYIIAILIGHLNHANIYLPVGPLKYIFNTPQMHIWHHAEKLPDGRQACNFGLSLSCWDYLFKTAYIPTDGRDVKLGFKGLEKFPKGFIQQFFYGFWKTKE